MFLVTQLRARRAMSSENDKPERGAANQPASARAKASAGEDDSPERSAEPRCSPEDAECLLEDLDEDLAERHVPFDGAPPEHWKHVDTPLTPEERMKVEAAREEHQERMSRGRPRGKI
jgi:hypothetical protein